MRFFDLVSLIAYNLSRRKGRVALTAIGVVIGTAAVVLLVALASGLQRNARALLVANFAQQDCIWILTQYGTKAVCIIQPGCRIAQPRAGGR
mgnify:CR=1 FL=1